MPSSVVISRAEAPIRTKSPIGGASSIVVWPDSRPSERRLASSRTADSHGSPRSVALPCRHDPLDVEDTDQAGDRLPEIATGRHDDPAGLLVPGLERGPDVVEGQLAGRGQALPESRVSMLACELGRTLDDRPRAGHRLEAAEPAAAASGAVLFDHRVADLAGAEAVAVEELAIEDDAGADPSADLDRDEVRSARAGRARVAEQLDGERRGAAVVGQLGGDAVPLPHEVAERQVLPVEVDGPADGAGRGVDDARRADADARAAARAASPASSSMSS